MTTPERAPLGAALALLFSVVALTGALSPVLMAVAVALLGAIIGIGWPRLLELPSRLGTMLIVGGSGIASALLVVWRPERLDPVTAILIVCALGVLASFIHQMLRRSRHDLTSSLAGTVAGVFVTGFAACWVLAQAEASAPAQSGLIAAIGIGLSASLLVDAAPLPSRLRFGVSVLLGAAITGALAMRLADVALLPAALVGAVVAIGASCTHLLLGSSLVGREPAPSFVVSAGPVATVGVVAMLATGLLT